MTALATKHAEGEANLQQAKETIKKSQQEVTSKQLLLDQTFKQLSKAQEDSKHKDQMV